jgi:predicted transcriptional regulator
MVHHIAPDGVARALDQLLDRADQHRSATSQVAVAEFVGADA